MDEKKTITVKEAPIEDALAVHTFIPEFDSPAADVKEFEQRYEDKKHIVHVAYLDEKPIGYMISYDRFNDGSIYCWMAGVLPEYRKLGALSKMMQALEAWCKANSISKIKIKTRNSRREMLHFLIKNGYLLTEVIPQKDMNENRIVLEKVIGIDA